MNGKKCFNPDNLCVVIEDLREVLICFRKLKDLSAEQLVTGRVNKILTKTSILGYMEVICGRVVVVLVGRLFCPCSLSYCCHFIFQQSNSLLTQCGDRRSFWYILANL